MTVTEAEGTLPPPPSYPQCQDTCSPSADVCSAGTACHLVGDCWQCY